MSDLMFNPIYHCIDCEGTGVNNKKTECVTCDGTGKIRDNTESIKYWYKTVKEHCPICGEERTYTYR